MNKTKIRGWRAINILLITTGLLTPWDRLYFDIQIANQKFPATPEWKEIFAMGYEVIHRLITDGFEVDMIPFWLFSLSGMLIILYLIFNLFSLMRNRDQKRSKTISIILIGIAVVFYFPIVIGSEPLIGYWIINIGILSSAILEWQKFKD